MIVRLAILLPSLVLSVPALAEETPATEAPPAAAPAPYDKDRAHGYLGFGLIAASSSASDLFVPDAEASGGGLLMRGAGHSARVRPSMDISFTGQLALMGRTFDDTDEEVGDVLFEVDGGLRFDDLLYVALGYLSQSTSYEDADLATTYDVIAASAGLLKTTEAGYYLLQLKLGGGSLSNDQNNDTESVQYGGIRAVMQHGFGSKVQFLLGIGLDRFDLGDYQTDDFVRLEFGLGFGI